MPPSDAHKVQRRKKQLPSFSLSQSEVVSKSRSPLPPLNKSASQKKFESSISRFEQSYKDESNSEESFDSTDDEKQRQRSSDEEDDYDTELFEFANINIITSIRNFLETINQFKCPKCDKTDSYCFHITKRLGLVYFINFICSNCENVIRFTNGGRIMASQTKNSQMTDVNMMLVLGGALVGLNRRGLSKVVDFVFAGFLRQLQRWGARTDFKLKLTLMATMYKNGEDR
ncbi:unnamed protein product [Didymodactylos carnosus]|uniref:Uncharacterized protein n=1 Tax=Didymodactylos carnosus TaxID=1234261 RepID=A0A815Z1P5_9BILA|nr:unnamed protein product [Didymodactylos carnosus]CAF4445421.1 unnamed protein product [Didymodactylos carnosus]